MGKIPRTDITKVTKETDYTNQSEGFLRALRIMSCNSRSIIGFRSGFSTEKVYSRHILRLSSIFFYRLTSLPSIVPDDRALLR